MRERILDAAFGLFYQGGIHATGIDRVIEASGVAKMTLYKYFPSKQDLVLAVLERRDQQWMAWFEQRVSALADSPNHRLFVLFDALDEWFREEGFSGCAFINACAEFAAPEHPAHQLAARHVNAVRDYIQQLALEAGAKDPSTLADQLALLVEGAIVVTHVAGRKEIAQVSQAAALLLLKAQGINNR